MTEALACGLPVVSVSVANIGERIDSVPYCSIVPRDPQRISENVSKILTEKPRIHPVPRLEGLTAEDVASRLAAIYRDLIPS